MNISIIGRHLEVTDATRHFAEEKLKRLERFCHSIQSIEVLLKNEDRKSHCEIIVHVKNKSRIVVDVARDDLREAIDVAVDKCERQLCRVKEKYKERRRGGRGGRVSARQEIEGTTEGEESEEPEEEANP